MTYNQATLHASTGKIIMLPNYEGYFYWNFGTKAMSFRNGNYHTTDLEHLRDREDWYYII